MKRIRFAIWDNGRSSDTGNKAPMRREMHPSWQSRAYWTKKNMWYQKKHPEERRGRLL